MAFEVGGSTNVSGDLTVQKPICPCCGSAQYHVSMLYDDAGIVIGKSTTCLECRDTWCKKCSNDS